MYQKLYSVKNILKLIFFVFALMNFTISSAALPVPAPPEVAAKNYLLIDFASGKVLAEKNADEQIEPASITKLMTAYVVYKELDEGRLNMDDMVDISEKAWRSEFKRLCT